MAYKEQHTDNTWDLKFNEVEKIYTFEQTVLFSLVQSPDSNACFLELQQGGG